MTEQINSQSAGGHARAAALSPEARSEIARRGANARWGSDRQPQPLTGAQMRAIVAKIKRHSEAIGRHRDQLRGIYADLEAIVESADDVAGEPLPQPSQSAPTLADHIAAVEAAGLFVAKPGKRWRHRKRGTTYRIAEPVTIQCDTPVQDGEQLVAYRADAAGKLWARRPDEFYDGRFSRVPDAV